MKTLWITGASGVVGMKLVQQAVVAQKYDHIIAMSHGDPSTAPVLASVEWRQVDIGDRDVIQAMSMKYPPTVIINPAAMTNVDACETKQEAALRANAEGPRHLAEVARQHGANLIHVSTDYVFPGDDAQPGPYREGDPVRPVSFYGQSKLEGELAIQQVCGSDVPYLIARTALVVGSGARTNFVKWLVTELRNGRRVRIVRDQYNTPTVADDLAADLLWLAEHDRTGIYHVAGPDLLGRHEWTEAIVRHFNLDLSLVDWVTTAELNQPAQRPLRSGLLCERLQDDIALGAPAPRGIERGLREVEWFG